MAIFLKRTPKLRISGPRGGCFYINPSRRGPVAGFWGFSGPTWRGEVLDPRGGPPGDSGNRVSETSPGTGDRAPARGVDVKPPSPRWPSRTSGPGGLKSSPGHPRGRSAGVPDPGALVSRTSWSPGPGSGTLRDPGRALRPRPRRGFYINPSRRGPAVSRKLASLDPAPRGAPGRPGLEGADNGVTK